MGGEGLFVRTDVRTDVRAESQIEAMVGAVVSRYGALHFAINNAGHSGTNDLIEDQTAANFDGAAIPARSSTRWPHFLIRRNRPRRSELLG